MQVFDITIAAGASRQIDVQASYIYYLNGSAGGMDTTIELRPISGGETVYLKPGQAYKMPQALVVQGITRWIIKNLKGEATITGQVLMGEGEFTDNRITGSVEVVDGGKARSLAGRAYMCAISAGISAGQFAFNELWNPLGSGKNVIVEQWSLSSAAASNIYAGWHNVRLTAGPNGSISKKAGGALSSALVGAVYRGVAGGIASVLSTTNVPANQTIVIAPKEPIIIPPGFSFYCENQTASSSLQTWFEFFEEDVSA